MSVLDILDNITVRVSMDPAVRSLGGRLTATFYTAPVRVFHSPARVSRVVMSSSMMVSYCRKSHTGLPVRGLVDRAPYNLVPHLDPTPDREPPFPRAAAESVGLELLMKGRGIPSGRHRQDNPSAMTPSDSFRYHVWGPHVAVASSRTLPNYPLRTMGEDGHEFQARNV